MLLLLWACRAQTDPSDSPKVSDPPESTTGDSQDSQDSTTTTDPCATGTVTATIVQPLADVTVATGDSVGLSGVGSDDNPALEPLSYLWKVDGLEVAQGAEAIWLATVGSHALELQVQDTCGHTGSATQTIIVEDPILSRIVVHDAAEGVPQTLWTGLSASGGQVWGSSSLGVYHLDATTLDSRLYTVTDGLLITPTSAVLLHSDGTIWAGHQADNLQQGEHFSVESDGSLSLISIIDYTESAEIAGLFRLREQPFGVGTQDVWMGTNEGICLYDADLGVFQEHAHPTHPHGYSYGLAFSPDGHVWNGDQYQLSRWNYSNDGDLNPSADLAEYWVPWQVDPGLPVDIRDLDASDWTLWVVSSTYGVARVDVGMTVGTNTTRPIGVPFPLTAWAVRVDGVGNVWIGSDEGLFVYDTALNRIALVDMGVNPPVSQLALDNTTVPPTIWAATPTALVEVVGVPANLTWIEDAIYP